MAGRNGNTAEFELNKVIPDRTYKVMAGTDLQEFTKRVATFTLSRGEVAKVVADPGTSADRKFYKVELDRGGEWVGRFQTIYANLHGAIHPGHPHLRMDDKGKKTS
jgi:hypothetical protein